MSDWFLIGIGSNRRTRWGGPQGTIAAFLRGFAPSREPLSGLTRRREGAKKGRQILALSRVLQSRPVGPGARTYANAVVMIESRHRPDTVLKKLKKIEREAGRRPGRRWGDRPLDLDIIAWSGGIWASPGLTIPHPEFRKRRFVLAPLCEIAPDWRDPVTHLAARQLLARLDRKRPRT